MSYQLGIDLGTTFTAATVCRPGRGGSLAVEPVTLGTASATVPSVLYLGADGSIVVGEAAERRALNEPDRVVREFKRRIGDDTPFLLGGREYRAHELAALLVRWVCDQAAQRAGGPPAGITVTHPATWRQHKKELLGQALERIGRRVRFLAEPQAAALSYASAERVAAGSTIAVYDLGGGTFDAAVVRKNGTFTLLGEPEGIERLGGLDFDDLIFTAIRQKVGEDLWEDLDPADPAVVTAVAQLRRECVEAKIALSADSEVTIPVLLPELRGSVKLTREQFEGMIRGPLDSTLRALRQTITSAGLTPADLSAVLLVGGSSRIPLVAEMLKSELGRPVALDVDPELAIAMGAAVSGLAPTPVDAAASPPDPSGAASAAAPPAAPGPPAAAPPAYSPASAQAPGYPPAGPGPAPGGAQQFGPPAPQYGPASLPPYGTPPPYPPAPPYGPSGPTGASTQVPGGPPGPPARPTAPGAAPFVPPAKGGRGRKVLITVGLVVVLGIAATLGVIFLRDRLFGGAAGPGPSGGPPALLANIKIGGGPDGVAVTPDGKKALVTDAAGGTVTVIDTTSNTVAGSIKVTDPVGIAITGDGQRAYVVNNGPGTVSVVDLASNTVTGTVKVGAGPVRVALAPDGSRAYVTNQTGSSVSVIDTGTQKVTTVPLDGQPAHPTVAPDGSRVYVTVPGANTVAVIDPATASVVDNLDVPGGPFTVAVSPDGKTLYITNVDANTVTTWDVAARSTGTIAVGKQPVRVVITPDGSRLFVTNSADGSVTVIDLPANTVSTTIPVGPGVSDAAISADGKRVYTTDYAAGAVSVIGN